MDSFILISARKIPDLIKEFTIKSLIVKDFMTFQLLTVLKRRISNHVDIHIFKQL